MPFSFTAYRPQLRDLSDAKAQALASAIKAYATEGIVGQHKLRNGAHGLFHGAGGPVLPGTGREFFVWHRRYLEECEKKIGQKLPVWRPWQKIPKAFLTPANQRGNVHDPVPPVSDHAWHPFASELIGFWPNKDTLGTFISWGPHFRTHVSCGGEMAKVPQAPGAPIFWCWHAFIDDLFEDWKRRRVIGPFPPIPWPWSSPAWESPDHDHNTGHTLVPIILGMRRSKACEHLRDCGLVAGELRNLPHAWSRVVCQKRLPFSHVSVGSAVDLSGVQESNWARPE